jgi:hypothetical protein
LHREKPLEKSWTHNTPSASRSFHDAHIRIIQTPQNYPWPEKWRKPH